MGDDDEFWEGYVVGNSDSNGGGGIGGLILAGFALAFFLVIYPFLPWIAIWYDIGDYLGNGLNILKWGGAAFGGAVGAYWNFRVMRALSYKLFGVTDGWKFTTLCYGVATIIFFSLFLMGSKNPLVVLVCSALIAFTKWLFSYS